MTWRPQAFGRRNARDIVDPIIEPLWLGDRVVVTGRAGEIGVYDTEGEPVSGEIEPILDQLRMALLADEVVLDGYLTRQATPAAGTVYQIGTRMPTAGELTSQMLVGRGLRGRAPKLAGIQEKPLHAGNPLAFVSVDIVMLDGEPLVDIPLLERKRLLDSVIREASLVRRGAFVRPPVDTWLASWRSLGFHELAYKAANGRYLPGAVNDSWAIARIPTT